jgi:hypothetical protein
LQLGVELQFKELHECETKLKNLGNDELGAEVGNFDVKKWR